MIIDFNDTRLGFDGWTPTYRGLPGTIDYGWNKVSQFYGAMEHESL